MSEVLKVCTSMTIVILFLVGCASDIPYTVSADIPKEKLAKVNIYRTDVFFHSMNPEKPFFYIDRKYIGKLGTAQHITVDVEEGEHNLTVKSPIIFMPAYEKQKMQFTVEPQKQYYIRYSEDMGGMVMGAGGVPVVTGSSSLMLVDKELFYQKK